MSCLSEQFTSATKMCRSSYNSLDPSGIAWKALDSSHLPCRETNAGPLRVRAMCCNGQAKWFDAKPVYVFSGALDLAVIKIEAPSTAFNAAPLFRGRLQVGQDISVVSSLIQSCRNILL